MTVSHNRDVALRNATRSWHCYTLVRFEFITRKTLELVYYEIDVLSRNLLHIVRGSVDEEKSSGKEPLSGV